MEHRKEFIAFLRSSGVAPGQHVILHAAFRRIHGAFPTITIADLISAFQEILTSEGSLILPTFTYCFKKQSGFTPPFVRDESPSVVGAVSEVFRQTAGVVRTSSPTHSFGLWGRVTSAIPTGNNPASPLGRGSVLDWLVSQENSFVLMMGTDFASLSFGHFVEVIAPVPWANYSPWPKGDYLNVGVSRNGEVQLDDVPRCSKQFTTLECEMLGNGSLVAVKFGSLSCYWISIRELVLNASTFFRSYPERLLCEQGSCDLCDARRERYLR